MDSHFDKLMGVLKPFLDPQMQQDMVTNARNLFWMPDRTPNPTLPSEEQLAKMDLGTIRQLRDNNPGQSDQNYLAPFDHRAYVRDFGDNPIEKAVIGGVSPVGYGLGKQTGLIKGRSNPSWTAVYQGLLGALDKPTKQ
jgi:hypothetical protein